MYLPVKCFNSDFKYMTNSFMDRNTSKHFNIQNRLSILM